MVPVIASAVGLMTGAEVAAALGNLTESDRTSAVTSMARSGKISTPLSGSDGAAILQGSTQQARANAINELAPLFKANLSGQEAEAILGSASELSDNSRTYAIIALARAKRFGPSLSEDIALALKGTTQQARANAINEIASYLQADLSGQAIATILGGEDVLNNDSRLYAVIPLARAKKVRACMSADDMNLILNGMTGGIRSSAISEITNAAKPQCVASVSVGSTKPTPPPPPSNVPAEGFPPPSTTAGTTPTTIGALGSFSATVHCKYSATKRTQLDIRWSSSNGASTYEVFRDGVSVTAPLAKNVRTFSDMNVPLGKRSVYSVRSSNGQESITGNANSKDAGIGSVNKDGNSEVYCFSNEDIKIATENVTYAIFSNNVYADNPHIPPELLTKWKPLLQRDDANTGFSAQSYFDPANQRVVLVFRGTDGFWDWRDELSNVGFIPPQYAQANQFADSVLKLLPNGVKTVVFTGHSLGGGLAQYAAKKYIDQKPIPEVRTVIFDSSQRTGILSASTPKGTVFISATGEFLQYASLGLRPTGTRLDFLNGNMVKKHSITELACGLVYAAAAKNESAWSSVAKKCDEVSTVRWWVK